MKKLLLGFAMLTFAFMAFGQKDLMSDFNGDFESGSLFDGFIVEVC